MGYDWIRRIIRQHALVQQWIAKAENDLISVKRLLSFEDPTNDIICFHCQQAAEKYLKAYLVYHGIQFPKIHNLAEIVDMCSSKDASFKEIKERAETLTPFATEARYPDDWYLPSAKETQEALEIAEEIKTFVLHRIKLDEDKAKN
ncbi:HEPN domain-containing protein [Candidatus Poribacteria bacterium]|nr:HEPN domain-containing protein [Candidatus Poribacteria bacterium]